MSEQDTAPEAAYTNETGDTFTLYDAEAAGWRVVHDGVDPNAEDATANATYHRAVKYHNPPGRLGGFVEEAAETVEKLLERIAARERHLASVSGDDASNVVFVAAEDADEVDTSDASTVNRVPDSTLTAARDNDVLTVLSDPDDPDSDPVRKTVFGGEEVDESALSEPTAPSTQAEADTRAANAAAIQSATESRDSADNPEQADSAQARADAAVASRGAWGSRASTQPEAAEATDASDSEQQSQVPDSEAATSDASENASQPQEAGPDTDAEAPAPAPNAGQGVTGTGRPTVEYGNAGEGEAPKTDVTPTDESA